MEVPLQENYLLQSVSAEKFNVVHLDQKALKKFVFLILLMN